MNTSFPTTVLVVDDSSVMRTMIARGLVGAGVPKDFIRFAANGQEALGAISERPPGLVVTDINMPEMTGSELIVELAAQGRLEAMPVVVITSISSSRELLSLVRTGAAAVIRKPVDPASLIAELRPFIEALVAGGTTEPPSPAAEVGIDLQGVLAQACRDVLDRVPGCEPREPAHEFPMNRVLFGATLAVTTPFRGSLWVWGDQFAANRLSIALSGIVPERDDTARLDAIAELLNIVAGQYLALVTEQLGDLDHENQFGVPSTFVVAPGTALPAEARAVEFGEDELLVVAVFVDGATP